MNKEEIKKQVLEDVDPRLKKEKKKKRIKSILYTIALYAAIIAVTTGLFHLLIGVAPVKGSSMYPTLHDKDTVFYNRCTKTYARGDVVAIDRKNDELFVKRVVAVAGDVVNIESGTLYINGKKEKAIPGEGETNTVGNKIDFPITIKEGEVFVLGDNRENSEDSRSFGPVKIENLLGKLLWYAGKL